MESYKLLAKNTAIFAIGQFSVKIIQFFLMPIVTISMTTEDYGSAESMISLIELLLPLFTLGLQDAVFRFVMREDIAPKKVISTTMVIVAGGVGFILIGLLLALLKLDYRTCILFGLLYLCMTLTNIWGQFVRGSGKIKTFAFSGILQALVLAGATAFFVYWKRWGAYGYELSIILAYSSSLLVFFFAGGIAKNLSFRNFDKNLLRQMLKYALPLMPNMICWWFIQVINRFIIIYFLGESASGLYIATSKIATLINIFGTVFLQAWTISTVKAINDSEKGKFNSEIYKFYSVFLQIAGSALLLILPFVSGFLLQGEFSVAWRYSSLPIFTAIISCLSAFFGAYYGATMKTKMVFYSTLAGAVSNTLFCILFVALWGIAGALFASLTGYLIMTVIRIIDTKKYSQIEVPWLKEIAVYLLVFFQAVFILFSSGNSSLIYYSVQAAVILFIFFIKFKDIAALLKAASKAIANFISGKKSSKTTDK